MIKKIHFFVLAHSAEFTPQSLSKQAGSTSVLLLMAVCVIGSIVQKNKECRKGEVGWVLRNGVLRRFPKVFLINYLLLAPILLLFGLHQFCLQAPLQLVQFSGHLSRMPTPSKQPLSLSICFRMLAFWVV